MTDWTEETAHDQFSELIDKTLTAGPQTIYRNHQALVVLVSSDEWHEAQTAAEFSSFPASGRLQSFICG